MHLHGGYFPQMNKPQDMNILLYQVKDKAVHLKHQHLMFHWAERLQGDLKELIYSFVLQEGLASAQGKTVLRKYNITVSSNRKFSTRMITCIKVSLVKSEGDAHTCAYTRN